MRTLVLISLLSVGVAGAARAQSDTVVKVDSTIKVKEKPAGLLAEAKIQPLDAQHLALTKYPEGKVTTAEITRRGKDLVYIFRIERADHRPRQVLIDAMTGEVINTIPKEKPDSMKKVKPPAS